MSEVNCDTVRVAVIGAGAIGVNHIEGFQLHNNTDVVAIVDTNEERGRAAAKEYSLESWLPDYHSVLKDPSVDAVSIALPNYLHAPVALDALKAGKHVALDKPMATNAAEAQEVVDLAKKRGLILMVGQNMRFTSEAQTLKRLSLDGRFGELYHAKAYWRRRSGIPRIGSWFTQKRFAGGGCLYDVGVHVLDLALHLMGDFEVESVYGQTFSEFGSRGLGEGGWGKSEVNPDCPFDVEDAAQAHIRLKSGASISLDVSWAAHMNCRDRNSVELFGTEAGASWNPLELYRVGENGPLVEQLDTLEPLVPENRMVHFVDMILDGTPPFVPLEESLQVQRTLDAIYESAATGQSIRLS